VKITQVDTKTIQGPREYQQDRFLVSDNTFAVCDGVGGHHNGEQAAIVTVDCLRSIADVEAALIKADTLCVRSEDNRATTAAVAKIEEEVLYITNAGDSRVYLLRDKELEQITSDQGLRNYLFSYVGGALILDKYTRSLLSGDKVLLRT
jgi:serine/threonine protein phosphatase PrpC